MGNDFEKHIKNMMDNPPEFPFEERLWEDMESRLDEDKEKPFLGFVGRLPLFLLALLATGLAGFFYVKHDKAIERIAEIEQRFLAQQLEGGNSSVEKHVTVVYDTIYNRTIINETRNTNPLNLENKRIYKDRYLFAPESSTNSIDFRKPLNASVFEPVSLTDGYTQEYELGLAKKKVLSKEELIASLPNFDTSVKTLSTLEHSFLKTNQNVELPSIRILKRNKEVKRFRTFLKEIKPTDFALSGTTGTFASLNLGGNGFNLRGTFQGEVIFGRKFSIIAGGEYFSNDFNIKVRADEDGIPEGFPTIPASNDEDELLSIQGDFNYFQIPIGLKYVFHKKRYFYPYIGGGLVAGRTTRSRLEYRYLSASQGLEYAVSEGRLLPRTFEMSAFYSTLGFQLQLNRNWFLLMEGSSQFDLQKGIYKYENLSILKLSAGFRYRF